MDLHRDLTVPPVGTLYFAYGSNLNRADWTKFCLARGFDPEGLEPVRAARLPDYTLTFDMDSRSRRGGVLNLKPAIGCAVTGFLFRPRARSWAALDLKEGCGVAYERTACITLSETGEEVPAVTYIGLTGCASMALVPPTERYLELCRIGREKLGLETRSVLRAAEGATPEPIDAVFAYGTLMRRESRFASVARHGIACALLAETRGVLVLADGYPGLLPEPLHDVQGDFFRSRAIDRLLPELDRIEGFSGFGVEGNLFRRTLTEVHVGNGRVRDAWVYFICDPTLMRSPAQDWRVERDCSGKFLQAIVDEHRNHGGADFDTALARMLTHFNIGSIEEILKLDRKAIFEALNSGEISERELAQVSGLWAAICDS